MFVEDLKETFETEKKKQKEEQKELASVKIEPTRCHPPTNFSNINNDFNLNTSQINSLKRPIDQTSLKDNPLSPKTVKHAHLINNDVSSGLGVSSSPSSSSSTNYFKQEIKNEFKMSSFVNSEPTTRELNNYVDESSSSYFPTVDELNHEDLLLDFDDDDDEDDDENSREQINYCIMQKAQQHQHEQMSHNDQISDLAEFLNGTNNPDDLDGLDLNEDDLAVQSILDYWFFFLFVHPLEYPSHILFL